MRRQEQQRHDQQCTEQREEQLHVP
jgi:hypothetical protein